MKHALIEKATRRFCQRVDQGQEFPVYQALEWRDCPDNVTPATHDFDGANFLPKPPPPAPDPRLVQDEQERIAVSSEPGTRSWIDMTPDEAAQWVNDTFQARVVAGDTQVQAVLFIVRRIARLLLIVARRSLR